MLTTPTSPKPLPKRIMMIVTLFMPCKSDSFVNTGSIFLLTVNRRYTLSRRIELSGIVKFPLSAAI